MAVVMFTIAVFSACMATLVASETTTSTYDWERCIGGPKTGPKQLYGRLCAGEMHGECVGTKIRSTRVSHLVDCADVCTDEGETCGGFEYDNHDDDGDTCVLFYNVTDLKPVTVPWDDSHQCYRKEPPKVPKCKEKVLFGHYKRLCDRKKHGECQGTELGPYLSFENVQDCADACTANSTCAGFEYDSYDISNDCYLYSEVMNAEQPDWDDFSHECFKKLPTTTAGPTTSTVVTEAATPAAPEEEEAATPATPEGDADEATTLAAINPEGEVDKGASASATASSAPATQIVSALTIILAIASTFI